LFFWRGGRGGFVQGGDAAGRKAGAQRRPQGSALRPAVAPPVSSAAPRTPKKHGVLLVSGFLQDAFREKTYLWLVYSIKIATIKTNLYMEV
jgi:hypothetical protein